MWHCNNLEAMFYSLKIQSPVFIKWNGLSKRMFARYRFTVSDDVPCRLVVSTCLCSILSLHNWADSYSPAWIYYSYSMYCLRRVTPERTRAQKPEWLIRSQPQSPYIVTVSGVINVRCVSRFPLQGEQCYTWSQHRCVLNCFIAIYIVMYSTCTRCLVNW